jgi:hypothetical protein
LVPFLEVDSETVGRRRLNRSNARADIIIKARRRLDDQPFGGAEININARRFLYQPKAQPDAIQSSTISAPTSWAAAASAVT